jgi:hypothetical protein
MWRRKKLLWGELFFLLGQAQFFLFNEVGNLEGKEALSFSRFTLPFCLHRQRDQQKAEKPISERGEKCRRLFLNECSCEDEGDERGGVVLNVSKEGAVCDLCTTSEFRAPPLSCLLVTPTRRTSEPQGHKCNPFNSPLLYYNPACCASVRYILTAQGLQDLPNTAVTFS